MVLYNPKAELTINFVPSWHEATQNIKRDEAARNVRPRFLF